MWLILLVFVCNAVMAYLGGAYYDARTEKNKAKALWLGGLFDLVIGIEAMGFVVEKWVMLIPAILGGLVGTWFSLRE